MKQILNETGSVGYAFDVVSLARKCQMVPENDFILRNIAGEMTEVVRGVYQGFDLIYCFTERGRRHIIACVLAKMQMPGSEETRLAVLDRLLSKNNEELIIWAYGHCPKGFIPLLRNLDDPLLPAPLYMAAYEFVSKNPELVGAVLGAAATRGIDCEALELLLQLPICASLAKIWAKFPNVRAYERFLDAYRIVTGRKDIASEHLRRLAKGEDPAKLVNDLYMDAPFPPPALRDVPGVTYLANARQVKRASKEFRNCLGSFIEAAFQGQQQFYTFKSPTSPDGAVVFSIYSDMPFGYRLSEIKGVKNVEPPEEVVEELKSLLAAVGVEERPDADCLIRGLQRFSRLPREMELDLFADF